MNIFILLTSYIPLSIFSYCIYNLNKKKYLYHYAIGIISLWNLTLLIYCVTQTKLPYFPHLFNLICSIIFHFNSKISFTKKKIPNLILTGITWFFTAYSILLCFTGIGILMLSVIQPIGYLFGIKLLKNKKINTPVYINLIITWGFIIYITFYVIFH